jgi:hypothetical protein
MTKRSIARQDRLPAFNTLAKPERANHLEAATIEARESLAASEHDAQSWLENAITTGEALITAKKSVKHGEWQQYLEAYWPRSLTVARDRMRMARNKRLLMKLDPATTDEALTQIAARVVRSAPKQRASPVLPDIEGSATDIGERHGKRQQTSRATEAAAAPPERQSSYRPTGNRSDPRRTATASRPHKLTVTIPASDDEPGQYEAAEVILRELIDLGFTQTVLWEVLEGLLPSARHHR